MDILDDVAPVKSGSTPLMLVAVGPSGSGKSTLLGSLNVPTLFITRGIETHGADNAASVNANVSVLKLDRDKDGNKLSADQEVERLYAALKSPSLAKRFKAVAIDGWTEICVMYAQTTGCEEVCSAPKALRQFEEPRYVQKQIGILIDLLKDANERGLHVLTTCAGSVTSDPQDAETYEIKPTLPGHETGQMVVRCFPDIVATAKQTTLDDETGEIKSEHRVLFHATVVKRSKNKAGQITKQSSFSPRLRGKHGGQLPSSCASDLKEIVKLRGAK